MKYLTVFVHGEVHVISRKDRLKRNIWKRYLKPPYGPNGGNNQSWLFTAIQNKDILSKINELLRGGFNIGLLMTTIPVNSEPKLMHKGKTVIFSTMHLHSSLPLTGLIMKMLWQTVRLHLKTSF